MISPLSVHRRAAWGRSHGVLGDGLSGWLTLSAESVELESEPFTHLERECHLTVLTMPYKPHPLDPTHHLSGTILGKKKIWQFNAILKIKLRLAISSSVDLFRLDSLESQTGKAGLTKCDRNGWIPPGWNVHSTFPQKSC